ncbi:hypothetical protein BS47DRAFT_1398021 [Hydnum rufescens UP504]|uniref:Uncharacterized protein n=1 Tax=Hydnum rufescens UP504 TaxID=1448309 RepID=A0A9P6ALS4_9AGAM|nr:hypothetical protein BS47DRAFT_1398021 [Hydnum rufescens UP504]
MEYDTLPLRIRKQIDNAFNAVALTNGSIPERGLVPPAAKRRKLAPALDGMQSNYHDETGATSLPEEGGGFIPGDTDAGFVPEGNSEEGRAMPDLGGGFLVEDGNVPDERDMPQYISLSSIPQALQILDLPPSDPDVLDIFKSAASGWTFQGRDRSEMITSDTWDEKGRSELGVRREDWREVCSVLLAPRALADGEDTANLGDILREDETEGGEDDGGLQTNESEPSDSGDYYEDDEDGTGADDDDDDDGDDDEYEASSRRHSTIAARPDVKRSARRKGKGEGKNLLGPHEALRTFALFFPDVELTHLNGRENTEAKKSLEKKRIMIKDITRVATTVGEKIKMDEILEMLEAFSSAQDKSISLPDFERMVMAARLV